LVDYSLVLHFCQIFEDMKFAGFERSCYVRQVLCKVRDFMINPFCTVYP
jgi:hypothetical protein